MTPTLSPNHTRLLELHAEVMDAHRQSNVELLLHAEAPEYVVANRGEVSWPTLEARRERLGPYLKRTQFTKYTDVVPPIVTVSQDGTLGWVVVQVRAQGEQQDEAGTAEKIVFESAWIELYEKRAGEWWRVGNVSNFKP